MQLLGTNALSLHMREVEVFDTRGVNRALNKPASQSSNHPGFGWSASNAVNGNFNDFSHTKSEDAGTYQEWAELEYACFQHHVIHPKMSSLSHSCSYLGAWWEVDLGQDVAVSKVVIYNRIDCCRERLSNSKVSLLNYQGTILKSYTIVDATGIDMFSLLISKFGTQFN